MAVSTMAGDYGGVMQITCVLKEGNITVSSRAYSAGTYESVCTFASELYKGDVIKLNNDTANTYEATGGLPVVSQCANSDTLIFGVIVSEPRWVKEPTSSQTTWSSMLSGGYYRVATVEVWAGITSIKEATLTATGTTACVPGVLTTLSVDVSESNANHKLTLTDNTTSGLGFLPLTYAAASAATVTVLVGVHALGNAIT